MSFINTTLLCSSPIICLRPIIVIHFLRTIFNRNKWGLMSYIWSPKAQAYNKRSIHVPGSPYRPIHHQMRDLSAKTSNTQWQTCVATTSLGRKCERSLELAHYLMLRLPLWKLLFSHCQLLTFHHILLTATSTASTYNPVNALNSSTKLADTPRSYLHHYS